MRHSPVPMTASGSTRFETDFDPGTCFRVSCLGFNFRGPGLVVYGSKLTWSPAPGLVSGVWGLNLGVRGVWFMVYGQHVVRDLTSSPAPSLVFGVWCLVFGV
jgi:hypothetical protein